MSQINSNTKDDFQFVLLLSCFVGHPVPNIDLLSVIGFNMLYLFENLCQKKLIEQLLQRKLHNFPTTQVKVVIANFLFFLNTHCSLLQTLNIFIQINPIINKFIHEIYVYQRKYFFHVEIFTK